MLNRDFIDIYKNLKLLDILLQKVRSNNHISKELLYLDLLHFQVKLYKAL